MVSSTDFGSFDILLRCFSKTHFVESNVGKKKALNSCAMSERTSEASSRLDNCKNGDKI